MRKMKYFWKKAIAFTMCAVSLFAVVACSNDDDSSSGGGTTEKVLEKTGYKIVNRGVSEYKVVLGDDALEAEGFAATELKTFVKASTGAQLSVVSEDDVKDGEPVICLGDSAVVEKLGVTAPEGVDFGQSSYYIRTVGESLVILGGQQRDASGVLYGVYDFLKDVMDFEVYAADEIYYEEKDSLDLYKYDWVVKPTFDERGVGYGLLTGDMTYMRRMRTIYQFTSSRFAGVQGHNQVDYVLPASKYRAEHPDWYNGDASQLCWTAGEEMETEYAKNVIKDLEVSPDATYICMMQMDNNAFCTCNRCLKAKDEYGMNAQGLQIVWANNVIEKVEAMMVERGWDRDILYTIVAYGGTFAPPMEQWDDGTWVPYSDKVKPHEKLIIEISLIGMDFSKTIEHPNNKSIADALDAWRTLAGDNLKVYSYSINFRNYFINWNNIDTLSAQYRTLADHGVYYMYSQGSTNCYTPTFEEMRIFLETELMWDATQDTETLIKDFMKHYYREAADAIYEYYSLIRNRYAYYLAEVNNALGGIYSNIGTAEVWPEPLVTALGDCIDDAFAAIEPLKTSNPALYETLFDRIMKQNLSVLFLKLTHYQAYSSPLEVEQMKQDFYYYTKKLGITIHAEGLGTEVEGMFD